MQGTYGRMLSSYSLLQPLQCLVLVCGVYFWALILFKPQLLPTKSQKLQAIPAAHLSGGSDSRLQDWATCAARVLLPWHSNRAVPAESHLLTFFSLPMAVRAAMLNPISFSEPSSSVLRVVWVITSFCENRSRRDTFRTTQAVPAGWRRVFLLVECAEPAMAISREQAVYHDIIGFTTASRVRGTTNSGIRGAASSSTADRNYHKVSVMPLIIRWVASACPHTSLVIKQEDDVRLNLRIWTAMVTAPRSTSPGASLLLRKNEISSHHQQGSRNLSQASSPPKAPSPILSETSDFMCQQFRFFVKSARESSRAFLLSTQAAQTFLKQRTKVARTKVARTKVVSVFPPKVKNSYVETIISDLQEGEEIYLQRAARSAGKTCTTDEDSNNNHGNSSNVGLLCDELGWPIESLYDSEGRSLVESCMRSEAQAMVAAGPIKPESLPSFHRGFGIRWFESAKGVGNYNSKSYRDIANWGIDTPYASFSNISLPRSTLEFTIDHPSLCGMQNEGGDIHALVVVPSAPTHVKDRETLRSAIPLPPSWRRIFLLGNPVKNADHMTRCWEQDCCSPDLELAELLKEENAVHGDIVVANINDTYQTLALKTVAMLDWATTRCPSASFLFKVDDDLIPNYHILEATVKGYIDRNEDRNRWVGSVMTYTALRSHAKTVVTLDEFPGPKYSNYMSGPRYWMSMDVARNLQLLSRRQACVPIEDACVGVLGTLSGYEPQFEEFQPSGGAGVCGKPFLDINTVNDELHELHNCTS